VNSRPLPEKSGNLPASGFPQRTARRQHPQRMLVGARGPRIAMSYTTVGTLLFPHLIRRIRVVGEARAKTRVLIGTPSGRPPHFSAMPACRPGPRTGSLCIASLQKCAKATGESPSGRPEIPLDQHAPGRLEVVLCAFGMRRSSGDPGSFCLPAGQTARCWLQLPASALLGEGDV
jgi:hypothetical protein